MWFMSSSYERMYWVPARTGPMSGVGDWRSDLSSVAQISTDFELCSEVAGFAPGLLPVRLVVS